ncbi:MAG: MATE family efflux transporter [Clostridia bacterium]|nr:MATE family efflux transporter [Clostridia bacterium]
MADLLAPLRSGKQLRLRDQIALILRLSLPAIMAQLSSIVMQYIDAAMVGRLGANDSASIGLVASSTWLFNGLCNAAVIGFSIQVAQQIGADNRKEARSVVKQGFVAASAVACLLCLIGALISPQLPIWLGGGEKIAEGAFRYFLVYALSLPVVQLNNISHAFLQASGNMKTPGMLYALMCGLDVVFNAFLIFPKLEIGVVRLPGADLGLTGAALGTALSQVVIAVVMMFCLLVRSPALHLRKGEGFTLSKICLTRGVRLALPVAVEQCITCGAYIMFTIIVAPLGNIAIAANSFAITAESLCYMPGYGIGSAATTIIGQSVGAARRDLTRKLGWLTTLLGMLIMIISGGLMYLAAPWMMAMLSPDVQVIALGTQVLRIEAFAEGLYGASIVALGVFRGAGDTLLPSLMNFGSMWLVRLPLAAFLAPRYGLVGVWVAMALELCVRGILFLIRLKGKKWEKYRQL